MSVHNRKARNKLSKSLEQILEDAFLGVELHLSGRNLKDIPKHPHYDLSDTVVVDLSENRFEEMPEEVFTYEFMEKLLLPNNMIRCIPDVIGSLQSLTYLDLSNNQISEVPRELCSLPLEILLLSENQISCLPKELGKLSTLQDLDVSHNRISQIPITIGDMTSLKALNMANNQIALLPLQITYLQLEYFDISCNCISSLPLELRHMHSLIEFNVEHNPLLSPPTTVCLEGILHIFHYLETLANKDNSLAQRRDETRRSLKHPYNGIASNTLDCVRNKNRQNADSGYSTCDGMEKRWSNEAPPLDDTLTEHSGRSTPSTLSPVTVSRQQSFNSESKNDISVTSVRSSPDSLITPNGDEKAKVSSTLTYRQYKEALRQQRQQDVYRPRSDQSSPSDPDSSPHSQNQSPIHTNGHTTLPNNLVNTKIINTSLPISQTLPTSPLIQATPRRFQSSIPCYQNGDKPEDNQQNKRPVQKVVPSRNTKLLNGSPDTDTIKKTDTQYVKPVSPTKTPLSTIRSGIPSRKEENGKVLTTTVAYLKGASVKPAGGGGRIPWNKDVATDKLNFTMKREFDKQKEETDLLAQLRTILEARLKMSLPSDLAPVLADGVVLCHLANNMRPRSVASVHVPSPAQPKLTMARCRRNVENFLEACRKIGVEEEWLCLPEQVTHAQCDAQLEPLALTVLCAHNMAVKAAIVPPPYTYEQDERPINNFNTSTEQPMEAHNGSQKLMCNAADVLEAKGTVQLAITVTELARKHSAAVMDSKLPQLTTTQQRIATSPSAT